MDGTPNGETVTPGASQTTVTTPSVPPVDTAGTAEVERLRKELEQKELRNRQLENEKVARDKADTDAKQKQLEEENQYKELFEQEKAKNEDIRKEQEENQKKAELEKAKQETLSQFSDDVKKLAEEVGIELADTDESSVEAFKGKLEKISTTAASQARVTPNNPNPSNPSSELTRDQIREALANDDTGAVFHDMVTKQFPGIASMTKKK